MSGSHSLESQARRLRELFRGRFNQATATNLIDKKGGLENASDFLLNGDVEEVRAFLQSDPSYLESLRQDSKQVASLLENCIDSSIRQFACKKCNKYWWRRVPARKEVSKCNNCKVRYEPIPTDLEWGVGKFICVCGNEFPGFGQMGITLSPCYNCGEMVPIHHMLPPRKNISRKTKAPHSCNAPDCISNAKHRGQMAPPAYVNDITHGISDLSIAVFSRYYQDGRAQIPASAQRGPGSYRNTPNVNGGYPIPYGGGQYYNHGGQSYNPNGHGRSGSTIKQTCVHPKANFSIPMFSTKHRSTGSTVTTCLSQGSLDDKSTRGAPSLPSINEG
ncbi:UPF0515 protein C19orf66 isoform X1 [Biomphalaria glabrata]|nr:UPF0515 protein C19orf66 isoform X1 [Biomphalaria glabrata]